MNVLVVDLETTGLDGSENSIVEIAASLHSEDGKRITFFNEKCFAGDEGKISLDALKINGSRMSSLRSCKPEKQVLEHFVDFLLDCQKKGEVVLAGHNVEFDRGFLKARLGKAGFTLVDSVLPYRVMDTCVLARTLYFAGLLPGQMGGKGTSLKGLAEALKLTVEEEKLHTAMGDVELTVKVFFKLHSIFKALQSEFGKILYGENQ